MIALDNICKIYGGATALDRVSLRVERGEMVALTGCDGAGKSTLLRIVTTLLLPDSGSGTVGGMDIRRQASGIRRICGYMPERFSLYEDLTVEENLKFYATMFGTSISEGYGNIKGIYSQIERFKDRRAGALSGGMKQKLALCCALVHKPQLLEVEPAVEEMACRRIGFYERNGYAVLYKDYVQPSYTADEDACPLWIMGTDACPEIETYIERIKETVYRRPRALLY